MSNDTEEFSADGAGDLEEETARSSILQAFLWIYTALSLYVLVTLLIHERALLLQKRRENASQLIENSKGASKRYGVFLRVVNITAASLIFSRTIVEHAEVLYEIYTDSDVCGTVVTLKIVLAGLFFTAIYLFLWIKQRMCYSNPLMNHLTSPWIHVLSWASLAALVLAEVLTIGLFVFTRTYKRTKLGCDIDSTNIPPFLAWLVYGITTATFQIAFLALFIHPLLQQRRLMKSHNLYKDRANKLMPVIKRSLVACIVCVVTNLIVAVIIILAKERLNVVPIVLYNFNLVVNLVAVVMSFSKWRHILLPCVRQSGRVTSLEVDPTSTSKKDTTRKESIQPKYAVDRPASVFTISNNSSFMEELAAHQRKETSSSEITNAKKNDFLSTPSSRNSFPSLNANDSVSNPEWSTRIRRISRGFDSE